MMTPSQSAVEYQESGKGTAIVFVPGSFSAGSTWRGISAPLSEGYRAITTSLSGYGGTQERRRPGGKHIEDELDVLETVLKQAHAPVHLVAHSYGAWVALVLAIRRPQNLLSMTLLEPTAFNLLKVCGETALNQEVLAMVDRYMGEFRDANVKAVRHVIDFYGGAGSFDGYPTSIQEKLISQTATNVLDWQSGIETSVSLTDIAAVQVPTLVVCGSASNMPMKRCNQLLVDHLPNSHFKMMEGANHFMIGTHAKELTAAIERHLSGQEP
jgi:pimeloyl-ACP methyl ester carboxylesterase